MWVDRPGTIAVSLKSYFSARQTTDWCHEVARIARDRPAIAEGRLTLVVLPSMPLVSAAVSIFAGSGVLVGAQDLHWEPGAWTGAVAAPLLAELGCAVAELGHVERRILGDTDEIVARKTAAAVAAGLTPLICVGETDQSEAEAAAQESLRQLQAALASSDVGVGRRLLVGYEPVWAIGAEQPAPAEHVNAVASRIEAQLESVWPSGPVSLLYGGSAGRGLLDRLTPAIDGLFLGRFAHDPLAFESIVDEAIRRKGLGSPCA